MGSKVAGSKASGGAGAQASCEPTVTVAVYLVRHAHAQPREGWSGRDEDRPLTDRGVKEAGALADRFETTARGTRSRRTGARRREPKPTLLLASNTARCLATLAPLATACALPLGTAEFLLEGSDPHCLLTKVKELAAAGGVPVLCTHGDVIWGVVELLEKAGAYLPGPVDVRKGSIWVLEVESGSIGSARYVPPAKV
jgi:8-oxo-dGTP diphosphatase